MAATEYTTESLIGGDYKTDQVKFAADTYYRGMPLEYDSDNDRYKYLASGSLAAIFLGDTVTLLDDEKDAVIVWGEIMDGGVVDDSGDAYTITEDLIATWRAEGFFIKRT